MLSRDCREERSEREREREETDIESAGFPHVWQQKGVLIRCRVQSTES